MGQLTALGNSTKPWIHSGEIITYLATQSLSIGDLVIYCSKNSTVCHRILFKKKKDSILWYYIKGDNNFISDGWIPSYRILGKVTKVNEKELHFTAFAWFLNFISWILTPFFL